MDLEAALHDAFGLAEFRAGQKAVVESVLSGRPTVAVMPTGAGKSLCYQLPAVMAGGTAIVVSPLIALMKDQVDSLNAHNIAACAITSGMGAGEQSARLEDVANGRMRLVYIAPERFRSARFEDVLDRIAPQLSLLAIDEAHCISEWGHDFRPDYMRLGEVVARWRPPRLVALTATATPEVRRDIVRQLGMTDPAVFVRGFDRPNLRFVVEKIGGVADKAERLTELVREQKGKGTCLVYSATRKNAEAYADELRRGGLSVRAYHAGLTDDLRASTQDAFMTGKLDAIVATNAFGMGVDKADVRLVVHADLPRSPEAYYQEAGRGGRDGEPADCVLLFNHGDVKLQEFLIDANSPSVDLLRAVWKAIRQDPRCGGDVGYLRRILPNSPNEATVSTATRFLTKLGYLREWDGTLEALQPQNAARIDPSALAARADVERQKLRSMVDYAYATLCRRRFILQYFGDEDAGRFESCASCDLCEAPTQRAELTEDEKAIVRSTLVMVEHLKGRFGRKRVAALLLGDDDDQRFAEMPERGALRKLGERWVMDLIRALEGVGWLEASRGEYPTVSITRAGRLVADGVQVMEVTLPEKKDKGGKRKRGGEKIVATRVPTTPADPVLVGRLRQLRTDIASREAMPPYCVFPDKTIDAIARARPSSLPALGGVYGIGPAKLEKYGTAILALVRAD